MNTICVCGAIGHVLPPDFGYQPSDKAVPLLEWRGGNIGSGRIAVEELPAGVSVCPACQHRACVYVSRSTARRDRRSSGQ